MLKGKKAAHILIAFVLGYIPLIVHMRVFSPELEGFDWFYSSPIKESDFFLYYKTVAMICTGGVMLAFLPVVLKKNKELKRLIRPELIPLYIYAAAVLMSGMCSDNKRHAFFGVCEDFETVLTVLSYTVLFVFTYIFVDCIKDLEFILKCSAPGIAVIHLLSIAQLCSLDFFKSSLGKMLILPVKYHAEAQKLAFTFKERTVYATMYNSNYVPQYFCFFFFIFIVLALKSEGRKRAVWLGCSVASFICILGSRSKTGMIAVVAGLLFAVFFYFNGFRIKKGAVFIFWGLAVLLSSGILLYDAS